MGQKREVHVYRLAMRESVDERVLTVGVDRRAIASTYTTVQYYLTNQHN